MVGRLAELPADRLRLSASPACVRLLPLGAACSAFLKLLLPRGGRQDGGDNMRTCEAKRDDVDGGKSANADELPTPTKLDTYKGSSAPPLFFSLSRIHTYLSGGDLTPFIILKVARPDRYREWLASWQGQHCRACETVLLPLAHEVVVRRC